MYEGLLAETVRVTGFGGDQIDAYMARPLTGTSFPGVVVVHHAPGWDEGSKEITRKFAHHGYAAVCPNLHFREGPGASDDVAARVRAAGGVPDDRCMGDLDGAIRFLRSLPYLNGKVGIIGFCAGGRQVYLATCLLDGLDAGVDCWGGRVIAKPEELSERHPVSPITYTARLSCPLLGIFGGDDANPDRAQVAETARILEQHGKTFEFHTYEGAGHGFFAVDRPNYRPVQATEAWVKVFEWFERYLRSGE
jgi:carboxymethylenebutenolidase